VAEERQESDPRTAAEAARAHGTDTVEQLERLAELREQGILTEEEFRAEKQKLIHG